ncbi:MAG: hypothetical protein ACYC5O_17815 [Anaerolineae bacterium]
MRTVSAWLSLVLGTIVVACASCSAPFRPPPTPTPTPWFRLAALLIGRLDLVDGCLRIRCLRSDCDYLLVWPTAYKATIEQEEASVFPPGITPLTAVRVEDLDRRVITLYVGQVVRLGGGESRHLLHPERWQPLPEHCEGPFWLVGALD